MAARTGAVALSSALSLFPPVLHGDRRAGGRARHAAGDADGDEVARGQQQPPAALKPHGDVGVGALGLPLPEQVDRAVHDGPRGRVDGADLRPDNTNQQVMTGWGASTTPSSGGALGAVHHHRGGTTNY